MPHHHEQRWLPYTPEQVFAVVLDVKQYPEFLPWCRATRVYNIEDGHFDADVLIGYKFIQEKYSSRVHFEKPDKVDVEYLNGPFAHLHNTWHFTAEEQNGQPGCLVAFDIDFSFKSRLMQTLATTLMHEVVRRMVGAFEARAHALYKA